MCTHPEGYRKYEDGKIICCICNAVIKETNIQGGTMAKKPCDKSDSCLSVGRDCTLEGALNRNHECFEPPKEEKVDASESIPEEAETVSAGGNKVIVRDLPVKLTQEELSDHAEEMARLINLHSKATLELKAYTKGAKKIIDDYEEKYTEIALLVDEGMEFRPVQCTVEYDAEHGVKRITRCDTHETFEETLSAAELQTEMDFTGESSVRNVEAFAESGDQGESDTDTPFEEEDEAETANLSQEA